MIIDELIEVDEDYAEYFFKQSPSLHSFIAKIYAASIINLPLVIYGPTGVGKTAAARIFGRSRNKHCFRLSFQSGIKSKHIYGTTTILHGNAVFINGPLTTAIQKVVHLLLMIFIWQQYQRLNHWLLFLNHA